MAIAPIPPFPALSDRAAGTYNSKAFDWASHMANTFVSEANALAANLNSIAAGGAYAIPYTYVNGDVSSVAGRLALGSPSSQSTSTTLYLNILDSAGATVLPTIDSFVASSSAVKGHIRLVKLGDPSKWLRFGVTALGTYATYRSIALVPVNGSSTNPFASGDAVMLFFERTGDKGDTGPVNTLPMIHVREELAGGVSPANLAYDTWAQRALNTVRNNTVAGASLASSQVTLPAGTYDFEGSAPGYGVTGQHQTRLLNVTDNVAAAEYGTTEYLNGSSTNRSFVQGRFTLASPKAFALQHRMAAGNAGYGNGNHGNVNVFAEIKFTKIA